MQIDISAHIEKLLFEHETLIVPTFGGFTATRSPAAVDFVGGQVAPPAKTLAFNENLTVDDGILVHDISSAHGLTNDDARHLILEFVEKTKDALNQREIVTFPGVGRLYKNYAQKIQFLPDTTNFNTESFGLPPLQFSPIARAREAESVPAATGSSAPANGNASAPPQPAPTESERSAAASVAMTAATAAPAPPPPPPYIERTQQRSPMRSMAAFLVGLLLFAIAVTLYVMKRNRDARIAAANNPEAVVETREETPTQSVLPGPGGLISEAQKAAENEQAEKDKKAAPAIEDDSKDDDTTDEVEEAAAKKLEAASKPDKSNKTVSSESDDDKPAVTTDGKRCVLVVGTYQSKPNADKLLAKLKKGGYDTYYRMQKGHQVGIEFYYKDLTEVQEKIKALQKLTGEDDIWIKKK